jgi:HEAT repeat protein
MQQAKGPLREVLGRVLGEVATPSLGLDLLQFVGDDLDELRAAAARAMSQTKSALALDLLNELTRDRVWFVRLRAIVSLGKLSDPRAVPALLRGLKDSNRLVRLRAAEALVEIKDEMAPIFRQVVDTRDRYGFHAYLTALENGNLRAELEADIQASREIQAEEKDGLLRVLQTGALAIEKRARTEAAPRAMALPS